MNPRNTLAILTPSYWPDIQGFKRLHESVLDNTDSNTWHHAIVPKRDVPAFRAIGSPRLKVWSEADFLPAGFIATDALAALRRRIPVLPQTINCSAINLRRPWPPVRGWILQQILKLSAATRLGCTAVIVIDSDVVLVRPMPVETFIRNGAVRLYEKPGAVTTDLERHFRWTRTAYELLGLQWRPEPSFPDYVGGIVSWDPEVVQGCLARIEQVSGSGWAETVARRLHFSEFILYGTYLRHFGTELQRSYHSPSTLCHSYWSPAPLLTEQAQNFVDGYRPGDLAIHVQSNSGTPRQVIDDVLAGLAKRADL
ncbi:hypothetical protein D7Z96_13580 [Pseudarthrobacter phenanthrenivorans]|uniref:Uncharacterized protein n=1 Tax=Pseudarthrobacter phenanthrenivorans TaxID=361575 RepID=A0A3B0FLZ8_PSEPS|nr:DUF6492 family protein [Pseudarthrobacter phenanthrenivorans]RKO22591.1 hypothetical protein D7Z96_13580 [Pseudarthrobacter phenanthrenivorans]